MKLSPENIDRLDKILSAFDDGSVKTEEMAEAIDALITQMVKMRSDLNAALLKVEQATKTDIDGLSASLRQLDTNSRQSLTQSLERIRAQYQSELAELRSSLASEVAKVQALIPELPPEFDASDLKTALASHEKAIEQLNFLTVGENIRNALEALPEGDKLSQDAIHNLPRDLDELRRVVTSKSVGNGGLTRGGVLNVIESSNTWKTPGNSQNLTVSATPPSNPSIGDLWIDIS